MRLLSFILIIFLSFGLFVQDVQAKRFGGGRSFGAQRTASFSRMQSLNKSQAGQIRTNRWLGPLAGLATGGLLAYLLMGHGFGSGILSWLLVAGAIMLFIKMMRQKVQPLTAHSQNNFSPFSSSTSHMYSNSAATNHAQHPYFEKEPFLRDAKVQFIRLQAAYDQKNTDDIRSFTTPEVFAEIQLQLQERGDQPNHTEVMSLEAELLDVANDAYPMQASVRFSGLLKEAPEHAAAHVVEIWQFSKQSPSALWLVAGVQQD